MAKFHVSQRNRGKSAGQNGIGGQKRWIGYNIIDGDNELGSTKFVVNDRISVLLMTQRRLLPRRKCWRCLKRRCPYIQSWAVVEEVRAVIAKARGELAEYGEA